MEFKDCGQYYQRNVPSKCSRTRLEFKDWLITMKASDWLNAVAPDWNLKVTLQTAISNLIDNAVAPDWNLKTEGCIHNELMELNAVAPDWNLKFVNAPLRCSIRSNAVAPDWNLKLVEWEISCRGTMNAVAPDWNLKYSYHQIPSTKLLKCSRTRLEFKVFVRAV